MAVGPARVVLDVAHAALAPGEVLVAPVLDAGYGPLLAVAAGAVAEVGGLLSHGSVVARAEAAGDSRRARRQAPPNLSMLSTSLRGWSAAKQRS